MARKRTPTLTDGELRLMRVLWDRGRGTVQEVVEGLDAPLAYNTVLTTLRILEQKGYLERKKDGRAHVYSPAISRENARGSAIRHLMRNLFEGSPELLMQSLLEDQQLSPAELERLRRMIAVDEEGPR